MWRDDTVGLVLTRNEIWLLLHALSSARMPAVDWQGNAIDPWVAGELRARLQRALQPEPLSDLDERPLIRIDSDLGRSLAEVGVRPLLTEEGFDVGSLFAACAERGWGATVTLPAGSTVATPAEATVTVAPAPGDPRDAGDERTCIGLERPVVALARAIVAAALAEQERVGGANPTVPVSQARGDYRIPLAAIAPGQRDRTIEEMTRRGWELVGEDRDELVFRQPSS